MNRGSWILQGSPNFALAFLVAACQGCGAAPAFVRAVRVRRPKVHGP